MTAGPALAAAAATCGVFAAWEGLVAVEGAALSAALGRALAPLARARREGREPTRPERRRLVLVASAALLAAGWLLAGPLLGLILVVSAPWVVLGTVRARRRRYLNELEREAPVMARALADALAGGHSIRGAITAAAAGGVPGAAGTELRAAAARLQFGDATATVLEGLRRRAGARAIDTIVAAMLVQARSGGDLAGLLRGLAAALESSLRLEGDARAATAQARFTGFVVAALPLGAAVLAELARPGYISQLLTSPLSGYLLGLAAVLQAAAAALIVRLSRTGG
jgi:tight adherence protein B